MASRPVKSTYFSDYDTKKYGVMDEEELERSSLYSEWYRGSYRAKDDRGLIDLWKTIDEYWEGNANERQYEDDPASNTNIIHPMIEGQVALMADDNWEVQPQAQTPSELEYIPSIKRMLDFVFENNKFFQLLDVTSRRILKFGTGIMRVQYDPKWCNGFGLPIISPVNPNYIFPDPNVSDIYSIQEGRFIIETAPKSISWAQRKFGKDKAECIIPGYDPQYESTFYDENEYNSLEIQRMHYLHMWIWEKVASGKDGKDVKLRLTQMSADGTILSESEKFCSNEFPYFFVPCYYREGVVWGKGDAELIMDQQEQINDLDDQLLMNARLTGNPQKVADPSTGFDLDMWSNEQGLVLPTDPSSVSYLMPPSMPIYPINKRNRIMDIDVSQITRFYAQMAGGRIKGVDTATEALAMQQSGMTGIDHKKKILAAVLSEMTEYIFKMCLYYWDEEKYFTLTGEDDFVSFNPSSMKSIPMKKPATLDFAKGFKSKNPDKELPEYQLDMDKDGKAKTKEAQIKFSFKIGAGLPKNKAFLYTAMKELFAMQLVGPEDAKRFFRDQLGLPIPVQDQMTPDAPMSPAEMQSQTMNMAGLPMSGEQLNTAQGKRVDKAMAQTPNPMVQGLNSKDIVNTAGG